MINSPVFYYKFTSFYSFTLKVEFKSLIERNIINITIKIPVIPFPITGRVFKKTSILLIVHSSYPNRKIINPPAITEAICPATFADTACISKKF